MASAIIGWRYACDEMPSPKESVLIHFARGDEMVITQGEWTGLEWIDYSGRKLKEVYHWLYAKDIK